MKIRKKGVFIGAEVTSIDLTQELASETIKLLVQAHAEHGVLVFPKQKISSEDLMRFGRYFGKLSVHPFSSSTKENPELIVYDNKEGNPPAATDIWHTDETFRECPPMGTVLCSKIVPEFGGDTTFCNMAAVYEGLSDKMQELLSGLQAVHDFKPFRSLFPDTLEGRERLHKFEEIYPLVIHPVVRVHPVTGKKVLFVNPQFTLFIKGMEESESRAILELLFSKTHIKEYQYRHQWKSNMVVFWDNRHIQHSAVHDYYPQRRLMERVTISGDRPVGDVEALPEEKLRKYLMPPISAFADRREKRQHELD